MTEKQTKLKIMQNNNYSIKNSLLLLFLISIAFTTHAKDPVEFRLVLLNEFMQNLIEDSYPISIPVPVEYEATQPDMAPDGYSYWMPPKDLIRSNKKGDLPVKKGFMYGKISMNVGYDVKEDIFIGAEDPIYLKQAEKYFNDFHMERSKVGEHSILLVKMTDKESSKRSYSMYIATNIATNVIYIAFSPAKNSKKIGEFYWEKLKVELDKANNALSASPP